MFLDITSFPRYSNANALHGTYMPHCASQTSTRGSKLRRVTFSRLDHD
jgi:hypothetical protein